MSNSRARSLIRLQERLLGWCGDMRNSEGVFIYEYDDPLDLHMIL